MACDMSGKEAGLPAPDQPQPLTKKSFEDFSAAIETASRNQLRRYRDILRARRSLLAQCRPFLDDLGRLEKTVAKKGAGFLGQPETPPRIVSIADYRARKR